MISETSSVLYMLYLLPLSTWKSFLILRCLCIRQILHHGNESTHVLVHEPKAFPEVCALTPTIQGKID